MIVTDPGSFRDPKSRVYLSGARVLRGLRSSSSEVDALLTAGFLLDGMERGELVATSLITDPTELEELKIAGEGVRWQVVM